MLDFCEKISAVIVCKCPTDEITAGPIPECLAAKCLKIASGAVNCLTRRLCYGLMKSIVEKGASNVQKP
jgi:hypothetical protein